MLSEMSFPIACDRKKLWGGRMVSACHPSTLEAEGRRLTLGGDFGHEVSVSLKEKEKMESGRMSEGGERGKERGRERQRRKARRKKGWKRRKEKTERANECKRMSHGGMEGERMQDKIERNLWESVVSIKDPLWNSHFQSSLHVFSY